jgi:hypothetical protein
MWPFDVRRSIRSCRLPTVTQGRRRKECSGSPAPFGAEPEA